MAQVALSLTLVITASLFVRTLQTVAHTNSGYALANVDLASLDVSLSGYRDQAAAALVQRFQEDVGAISGVESVATARVIPLQGSSFDLGRLRAPGYQNAGGTDEVDADWNVVSPRYFDTVGARLVEGRDFSAADRATAPMVVIVNETFAKTAWPGRPAVGQRLMQEGPQNQVQPFEVVGVAADAKYRYFSDAAKPFVFVPLAQHPMGDVTLFIKHTDGRSISKEIRAAVARVEPSVPVILLQSFEDATSIGLIPQKVAAWTAGSVGTVGIFLAALGLYGLMAFLVSQRTREIAIRMALGASSGDLQSMVFKQAAWIGAIGGGIGLVLAGAIGVLVRSLLVGVPPIDPIAFGGPALILAAVLAVACWTPARRAASTDPATALRAE
jgi:predicted permease